MNEELANQIFQKDADVNYFIDIILNDGKTRNELMDLIFDHPKVYYYGYIIADKASEINPKIFYKYWDKLTLLLKHKNTYHRQIGIVLLANLSKADKNENISLIIDDYLNCLYDEKIHVAVYTAKYLKAIVKNKPEYKDKIIRELLKHRKKTLYTEKHEALLEYGFLEIIEEIYNGLDNKSEINKFILERQKSISPKTKKKAKEMVKELGIKQ